MLRACLLSTPPPSAKPRPLWAGGICQSLWIVTQKASHPFLLIRIQLFECSLLALWGIRERASHPKHFPCPVTCCAMQSTAHPASPTTKATDDNHRIFTRFGHFSLSTDESSFTNDFFKIARLRPLESISAATKNLPCGK